MKRLLFCLFVLVSACGICSAGQVSYEVDNSVFPNPERGFLYSANPNGDGPQGPMTAEEIKGLNKLGISSMSKYYLLNRFIGTPISEDYLKMMEADFRLLRDNGLKMTIRFTYNWLGGEADAPVARVMQHLQQLKPAIRRNADVIICWEVGFVGNWGEMHSSTNYLVNNWDNMFTSDTWRILEEELRILPLERMVAIRYPRNKIFIFPNPMDERRAFRGSIQSRIGAYNDSAFWSEEDTTYGEAGGADTAAQKAYLNQDNLYVIQTGETGEGAPDEMLMDRGWLMGQLERMRWSCIDYGMMASDSKAFAEFTKPGGIHEEINRRLGYRFELVKAEYPEQIRPGGIFRMDLWVRNSGFAAPFNPRLVEVVLRQKERFRLYNKQREEFILRVNEDPRFWKPGEVAHFTAYGGVPESIPNAAFDIYLSLPDPTPALYHKPLYSIRLANKGVWEPATGYNNLLCTTTVNKSAPITGYVGSDWFVPFIYQKGQGRTDDNLRIPPLPAFTYAEE